jgi:hypothetical protein
MEATRKMSPDRDISDQRPTGRQRLKIDLIANNGVVVVATEGTDT